MTKMKFAFAVLAALIGVGGAYASKAKPAAGTLHTWKDINGRTQLIGTTADAEEACPGNDVFCLRASDAPAMIAKELQ
jgi:hypothetical protein